MRAIIDGLSYDTSRAEKVGEASASCYASDFAHWKEELYRTTSGRYFLAGEGNAASSWSESVGQNTRGPGSGIRVLTEAEAQNWAERYLTADEYAAIWTPEEA